MFKVGWLYKKRNTWNYIAVDKDLGSEDKRNEINNLQTRLARLEAIINSSLIVDGTTNNGTDALKWKRI